MELYGFTDAMDQCLVSSGCACMGLIVIETYK